MPKVAAGAPAPDFHMPTVQGGALRLSDLRGQPVLLVFNRGFI
jgi:peroxiredoxin